MYKDIRYIPFEEHEPIEEFDEFEPFEEYSDSKLKRNATKQRDKFSLYIAS